MMFGHVETIEDRVEHLQRLRDQQDKSGGFTAFICWTFQPENTVLKVEQPTGVAEYLRMQALARIFLDNIPEHPKLVGDAGAGDRPGGAEVSARMISDPS